MGNTSLQFFCTAAVKTENDHFNAFKTWQKLGIDVALLGPDDRELRDLLETYDIQWIEEESKLPTLDGLLRKCRELCTAEYIGYIHCDLMISPQFLQTFEFLCRQWHDFYMVGRHWDWLDAHAVPIAEDFSSIMTTEGRRGSWHGQSGMDYFVFRAAHLDNLDIPPFLVPRGHWQHWLTGLARTWGLPLIDTTMTNLVIQPKLAQPLELSQGLNDPQLSYNQNLYQRNVGCDISGANYQTYYNQDHQLCLRQLCSQDFERLEICVPSFAFRSSGEEDLFVIDYFGGKYNGVLLDITTNGGITGSNSFRLLNDYHWKGLLVEPSRTHRKNLELLYSYNPEIKVFYGTIHHKEPVVILNQVDYGGASFTEQNSQDLMLGNNRAQLENPYIVQATSINKLLEDCKIPEQIDFISLHIREAEAEVLDYFNFEKYQVALWFVDNAKYDDLFYSKGYRKLDTNDYQIPDGNVFYGRQASPFSKPFSSRYIAENCLRTELFDIKANSWYQFGQLSTKQRLWAIAKFLSKKLHLYRLLRPIIRLLQSYLLPSKGR